jgi:hypothetical protein
MKTLLSEEKFPDAMLSTFPLVHTPHKLYSTFEVLYFQNVDDRGFESRQGLRILLITVSRQALEPTQPPIQWVPGALSLRVKRLERESDHSPPSSTERSKCV